MGNLNKFNGMRRDLYQDLYEQETQFWWLVGKRKVVNSLMERYLTKGTNKFIVDVGCGTGAMLKELQSYGHVAGIDYYPEALNLCRKRGIKELYLADMSKLPFKDETVDVITALDVVEHVKDDEGVINEFARVLKPGGILVVNVPAFGWLWSYWDDLMGHHHRYTTTQLKTLLEVHNFEINKISYWSFFVLLPTILVRRFKRIKNPNLETQSSDLIPINGWLNVFLIWHYNLEILWMRRFNFPFGVSLIALAQKNTAG